MRATILALMSLTALACDSKLSEDEIKISCSDTVTVTTTLSAPGKGQTVTGDLVVSGSASHSGDLAIHTLSVLGVQAENKGFNFDRWQATIPFATLLANRRDPPVGTPDGLEIALKLAATEACDASVDVKLAVDDKTGDGNIDATTEHKVYIEPPVPLGSLTATLTYPGKYLGGTAVDYLPAGGAETATLTVTGDADIVGARIMLEGTGALFDGIPDRLTTRLKTDDPLTVAVRSDQVGTISLLVRADEDSKGARLHVGGAPLFSPSALVLAPGDTVHVDGSIAGGVAAEVTCKTTNATGITVTGLDDLPVDKNGKTFKLQDGESLNLVVHAEDMAMPGLLVVSCVEEAYQQTGTDLVVIIE